MKKQFKSLVVVFTVLSLSLTNALANDGVNASTAAKNAIEVTNSLNKKAKKIVKKNAKELDVYYSVMNLFNNAPASFYNLDENTKNNFFEAASSINENLSTSKNKDVKSLASQIEFNSAVSKYIWNVKNVSSSVLPLPTTQISSETSL